MAGGEAAVIHREHKPTVPDMLPVCRLLYAEHSAGCCLHIVLDDYNVEDHSVEFCIEHAEAAGHPFCASLARALRSMSRTQRRKLANSI